MCEVLHGSSGVGVGVGIYELGERYAAVCGCVFGCVCLRYVR
jgi:hypothetical protein